MRRLIGWMAAPVALLALQFPVAAQPAPPAGAQAAPEHRLDWPRLLAEGSRTEIQASVDAGPHFERGRSAQWLLDQHRRLDSALAAVAPQRRGTVDAYVLVAGLDSDPVFGREAREAARVLARRYDAEGRTVLLAGSDGRTADALPMGTPQALALALATIAERMDPAEDVLVLYTTSHGARFGLAYHDGDQGYGFVSPLRLRALLDELGIRNRLLILSACYSGIFVPALASDTTAILTAASSQRPSFGCLAENDWTFFGDAAINRALREPQPLGEAAETARRTIAQWEADAGLEASKPQLSIGSGVAAWLAPLEARMPSAASESVGRPAIESLPAAAGH